MAVTMAACSLGLHFSADKNIASVLMLKASSVFDATATTTKPCYINLLNKTRYIC
ncbi:hypothetical protein Lalb_Chr00c36g0408811 [Lupinus albus]|uniref:Uncharacterized protein n=1 Tax=Lupinus albus TaxID=3870 RepID=A0A6A4MRP8_LUPAL|nr:hypothetical protein Lalb_Chr00c36g0408811 [Lupinus albus]